MAVCANGAVVYDPEHDRVLSARTLSVDTLAALAAIARRVIPGAGLAVERIGERAHDAATPQFISSPGYEHAWLNPDNTEVSFEDLLGAPAIKLLILISLFSVVLWGALTLLRKRRRIKEPYRVNDIQ